MLRARLFAKDSAHATQEVLVDADQQLLVADANTLAEVENVKDEVILVKAEVESVKDEVVLAKAELVAANVLLDDIKDLLTAISAKLPAELTVGGALKVDDIGGA